MGEVPGTRSMENSMSRSGGILGSSSGKISGYSFTTGTPSKDFTSILKTIGLVHFPEYDRLLVSHLSWLGVLPCQHNL